MIFDLEFNITSELTYEGLALLSDTLYNNSKNEITPSRWDFKSIYRAASKINSINTDSFNGMKKVPTWLYASGVKSKEDIKLSQIILRNNMICPVFNSGKIYTYKSSYEWSNHTITKIFENLDGIYSCILDENISTNSISVHTLSLQYPGYIYNKKDFMYVQYDNVSIESTFESSLEEYKFTIIKNEEINKEVAYLNIGLIEYSNIVLGTSFANKNSIIALPEFPIYDLIIENIDPEDYRVFSSVIYMRNNTVDDIDVKASFKIAPLITYKQKERLFSDDQVYKNINITPSAIGFSEGVLCAFNTFGLAGGSISSENGDMPLPVNLEISTSALSLKSLDQIKITCNLTGVDEVPIEGAAVNFEIISEGNTIKWIENSSKDYKCKTGLDGRADANLTIEQTKNAWFIQKEWVSNINGNGTIKIPFDIGINNPDKIFLYFVTSDDPILGRLDAGNFEISLEEKYALKNQLDTYVMNGRKIAYVKLQHSEEDELYKLKSSFIKPSNIINNIEVVTSCRDLFIKHSESSFIEQLQTNKFILTENSPSQSLSGIGYKDNTLPNNRIDLWEILSQDGTIIEYNEELPVHANIAGFWLITSNSGDISIRATFKDDENLISLESNTIVVPVEGSIKSESEFILSDKILENQNTALSAFGYFTISEYLSNAFGLNACSYGCIYSNAIEGKCINRNTTYNSLYYSQDSESRLCIHNPAYDSNIANTACPGLQAMFINPFIMKVEA